MRGARLGRTFVIILIAIILLRLGNRFVFRSLEHNQHVAARARQLSDDVRANPADPSALRKLAASAQSWYRFERCYSLWALGELGPLAKPALPTLKLGLRSSDPFVRDAAAHALSTLGKDAAGAESDLVWLIHHHVSERAGMYAVEALGKIGNPTPEVMDALRFAVDDSDSAGRERAQRILAKWAAAHP